MRFRTMLGLTAIGGFLFWHRKRGGAWTAASIQDSARDLFKQIADSAKRAEASAADALDEASKRVDRATSRIRH
jgi:hypothetical protein